MNLPNWNLFKAKFNDNPQDYFEWFCYLLFCAEFNKPLGIAGYTNHSYIENDPVEIENEVIGWQAKFFETKLSQNVPKIKKMLKGAKKDNKSLTKIIFYSNRNWGQGKKSNDPAGKIEIDRIALDLGVEIDWAHMGNYFKSPFVAIENKHIYQYFFEEENLINEIQKLNTLTINKLEEIKDKIKYSNSIIEINRDEIVEDIIENATNNIIISGVGGVGKTAVIKKIYNKYNKTIPIYYFKANEFNRISLSEFFGKLNFVNFIEFHEHFKKKIIVIDSVEKILEFENIETFKEFITLFSKRDWNLIFTIRENYVQQFNYKLIDLLEINSTLYKLDKITHDELIKISLEYSFMLPQDEKILDLIRTPFYLKEYLTHFSPNTNINYIEFKKKLWDRIISNPERDAYFIKISKQRAESGQFFIKDTSNIINKHFVKEGVLGFEENGYFITHDIYEEWALEKDISRKYTNRDNFESFFDSLSTKLPFRRAFRNWAFEQLLCEDVNFKEFVEHTIQNDNISNVWKDELLISILLSDYSRSFFKSLKKVLILNNFKLLKKMVDLLNTACKIIYNEYYRTLGIDFRSTGDLKYISMIPYGNGWKYIIEFVYNIIEEFSFKEIDFILPVIYEWNSNFKEGTTTKYSALIALEYYKGIIESDIFISDDDNSLYKTIIFGSSEIKDKLCEVVDDIIKNKWKDSSDPFYKFSKIILTKIEGIQALKAIPKQVLRLAGLFWKSDEESKEKLFLRSGIDIEKYFGLQKNYFDYNPVSAYQTPIYWLLRFNFKDTLDFILDLVNYSVEIYSQSPFDRTVKKVKVYINDSEKYQYVSSCLWNIYRGTSSPVTPYLLQSIHMALEKHLLEIAEILEDDILEKWLIYIILKTNSASLTAVIASIVLAFPEKTFNVAKILFKTKEFFIMDINRVVKEAEASILYSMFTGMNYSDSFYEKERIKTLDEKHRKNSLDMQIINYQYFYSNASSEKILNERREIIRKILDNYYLEIEKNNGKIDEHWKAILSRIDRRKITVTTKTTEEGVIFEFNPQLDQTLEEKKLKSENRIKEINKYITLKQWADKRYLNDKSNPKTYDESPKIALDIIKELVEKLNSNSHGAHNGASNGFSKLYIYYSTPVVVSSVMLKYFINQISEDDINYCKEIIFNTIELSFSDNYQYQSTDGVKEAFDTLIDIYKQYPNDRLQIREYLLLALFNDQKINQFYESFNNLAINCIHKLLNDYYKEMKTILFGFVYLKIEYDIAYQKIRTTNFNNGLFSVSQYQVLELFVKNKQVEIDAIIALKKEIEPLQFINKLDVSSLNTAFRIIPGHYIKKELEELFVQLITNIFNNIVHDTKSKHIHVKFDFLKTYSFFILSVDIKLLNKFLLPLLDNFIISDTFSTLFDDLIRAQDVLNKYDSFWIIWESFKEKILSLENNQWVVPEILKNYLFVNATNDDKIKEWHTLKTDKKSFFEEISNKIGSYPSVFYSICKLLNGIGSVYLNDGIKWISKMISNNPEFINTKKEINTIYYLEILIRNFYYTNQEEIKKNRMLKNDLTIILDFLVKMNSSVGFIIRDSL